MMTTTDAPRPQCPVCHAAGSTWAVCPRCVALIDSHLGELLDLHTLAAAATTAALTRGQGAQGPRTSGGSHEPPLGINVDAADLALGEALLSTDDSLDEPPWMGLETWERDWREVYGLAPYGLASADRLGRDAASCDEKAPWSDSGAELAPELHPCDSDRPTGRHATPATLVGVVGFLRVWWPRVAEDHPAADEFARDVKRMRGWARSAVRADQMSEHDRPILVIPCPGGDEPCGHRLPVHRQPLAIDGPPARVAINCPKCGAHWDAARMLDGARERGVPVWVSLPDAAAWLDVHLATIYRMVERGTLVRSYDRVDIGSLRREA